MSEHQFQSLKEARCSTTGGVTSAQSDLSKGAIPKVGQPSASEKPGDPLSGTHKTVMCEGPQDSDHSTESMDLDVLKETCRYVRNTVASLKKFDCAVESPIQEEVQSLTRDLLKVLLPTSSTGAQHLRKVEKSKHPRSSKKKSFSSDSVSSDEDSEILKRNRGSREHESSGLKSKQRKDSALRYAQLSVEELMTVLSRLDSRTVPRPEKFDLSSGRSFQAFLEDFESFCANTFRGDEAKWSSELGPFLTGKIKEAFDAFYFPGEAYQNLKSKLVRWVNDTMDSLTGRNRKKFERMRWKTGESLRLYAARLERSFVLAYPSKRPASRSSKLQQKFLESVPRAFRRQVTSTATTLKLQNIKLDWNCVLALASAHDAEREETDISVDPEAEIAEVWASTSATFVDGDRPRGRSMSPVSTSHSYELGHSNDTSFRSAGGTIDRVRSVSAHAATPLQRNVFDSRSCYYCKRKGHIKSECWRRSGRCLVCGSDSHRISQCDKRRRMHENTLNLERPQFSQRDTGRGFGSSGQAGWSRRPLNQYFSARGEGQRVTFQDQEESSGNLFAPRGRGTPRRS